MNESDVERVARAIQNVKGGEGFDYSDFCRAAAQAALSSMNPMRDAPPDVIDRLTDELEKLRRARTLAYGLLWHMKIDRRNPSEDMACRAREALLATMDKDTQANGIEIARQALAALQENEE